MTPLRQAQTAARQGRCSEHQMLQLIVGTQVALCIERQGVVRGLRTQLAGIELALHAIVDRALSAADVWTPPTLYSHELIQIETLLTLHRFQLSELSGREYRNAVALAKSRQLTHGGGKAGAHGVREVLA